MAGTKKLPNTIGKSSCPAKAGHPVNTDRSFVRKACGYWIARLRER
jgi:hypothetical protein